MIQERDCFSILHSDKDECSRPVWNIRLTGLVLPSHKYAEAHELLLEMILRRWKIKRE